MIRAALDSNIIIYAEDMFEDARRFKILDLLNLIPSRSIVIPVQAVGEVFHWLVGKAKVPKPVAAERIQFWLERYEAQASTGSVMEGAAELVSNNNLQVWDSVILSAAAEAGADILLSEDMQHGFRWRGVTIINPFLTETHPLITSLIST